MLRRSVLALCLGVASLTGATHAVAAADVWVRVAPPAARVENVPAHRRGYQWVPGHWDWRRNRYIWQSGTWVRERPGYVYVEPNWVERDGRWLRNGGQWSRRDRDGDGVTNRADRRPNDPNRQ